MRRVETELKDERAALVGRIAAGLTHDLNGPIGIVLGFNDLSRERLSAADDDRGLPPEDVKQVSEWLALVDGAAKRARALTQEISEFAQAVPGERTRFDLEEVVRLAARLATPALRNANVEIPMELAESESSAPITGDRTLTTQALVALLLDARASLTGPGLVSWRTGHEVEGTVLTMTAAGYDGSPGGEWPVSGQARAALAIQNSAIKPEPARGTVAITFPDESP